MASRRILRVDLTGEYQRKFDEIKKNFRYNTNAETIRALIDNFNPGINLIKVPIELIGEITKAMNPRTKKKYGIFTVEDFIKQAIISYRDKIQSEKGSLLDWEVRADLTESQRGIAIAFFELQSKNQKGLTLTEIAEFLRKEPRDIKEDLEYLLSVELVEKRYLGSDVPFYYAP
ncbi:MAG: hypothetical protein ACFFDI_03710 [Promethearchaeota archaeon]